ncbi:hypothetical protein [Bacillus paramycoides]|uniref:Uncharacterized protein n=1 Tax=Bacillus paramycoides TaxID=2026194 RepID=A0ABU6N384_9BACI|nr:hypothetical protein [Bacillus paramycoides]
MFVGIPHFKQLVRVLSGGSSIESWCHNGLEPFAVNINEATKQSKIIRIVLLKDYMAFEEQLRTEGG